MTPIELLDELIHYTFVDSMKRNVGDYIKRLPENKRKLLEKLTSKDASNMRIFWK